VEGFSPRRAFPAKRIVSCLHRLTKGFLIFNGGCDNNSSAALCSLGCAQDLFAQKKE
jgi:hypothetical protein